MSSFPGRFAARLARLRYLLPAIALALSAVVVDHPAVLVLLLLAQPMFLAGAVALLGYSLETDFASLAIRRGSAFLGLLVVYAAFVALVLGTPTVWLAQAATPSHALLVSGGFALAVLALWRVWPAFGLLYIWDDAYPDDAAAGSWILTAQRRAIAFGIHLARERDPFFARGLPAALALLLVVAGAMAIAGLGGLLPSELRVSAVWLYALVLCPLAHLVLARASERMLLDDTAFDEADLDASGADRSDAADPADGMRAIVLAPADLATRDAQLVSAAAAGQVDLGLALLEAGARADAIPSAGDRDQRSLLMHAAVCADARLLRALIAKGAEVNRSIGGLTPLLAATRDSHLGRPDAVLTLVSNGADPRVADADGHTPLHYAALSCEATVAAILLDAGADANAVNREGYTPLAQAAAAGNDALVRFLLERGARTEVPRAVPVLIAATGSESSPAMFKLLLKHKADANATDRLGRTALHAAALGGDADAIEVLLAAGAAVDARDTHGVTALMEAARGGANEVLQRLMSRKPSPDHVDSAGRTALLIACQSRQANEETIKRLLSLGADVRRAGKDGKRPVDYAVAAGRWTLVALLDPSYPLPAALAQTDDEMGDTDGASRIDLLTRALRHGRCDLATELLKLTPRLPDAELAQLLRDVADLPDRAPLDLLLRHGCPLDPPGLGNEGLLEMLAALRPWPLPALEILDDAAAPVSGGALLARLLDGSEPAIEPARLELLARRLLARGADPFVRDPRGRGVAHLAAGRGFEQLLADLLDRGVDPNAQDQRGRTALHELAALPDPLATLHAQRLLRAGADPERAAGDGQTPLGAALAAGRHQLARALSWTQGFRHPARRLREADLPAAAALGDRNATLLLLELGLPIDARDAQGATALLRACGAGHRELAITLLERGADPLLAAATGATALSAAVSARRAPIVSLLLERGVAADQRLAGGSTALMVAAALGFQDVVASLLARGAEAAALDEQGNGALHAAAQFGFHANDGERARVLLQHLLDAGAEVDRANRAGQTPLLLLLGARVDARAPAPQRDLVGLSQLLLTRGADANAQDQRGVTCLHAAAMHGRLDACDALLRAGADPMRQDRLGRTAAEISLMLGFADVASALKRAQHRAARV